MEKKDLVYKLVSLIPRGKVLTYAAVAGATDLKSPRQVGSFLHENKDPEKVPCHRVVRADGTLASGYAFGGPSAQARRLRSEEVVFRGSKVEIKTCLWHPARILKLFLELWEKFGDPGPWPWFTRGVGHSVEEIIIGSVLTQNTSWRNVEYALANLQRESICRLKGVAVCGREAPDKLLRLIRPSGFYRQKAECLVLLAEFIIGDYSSAAKFFGLSYQEAREKLLALNGIGPETADTILLFAGQKPVFVVDNYTKRFVKAHHLTKIEDYAGLQDYFEANLPENVRLYQDFHALIIRWAKIGQSLVANLSNHPIAKNQPFD